VTRKIAAAIEGFSGSGVHVRFAFCSLSEGAIFRLAEAVERNTTLKGFSCFQNPCNFPANGEGYPPYDPTSRAEQRVRQALVRTNAPLEIWNNNPLPDDVKGARANRKTTPTMVSLPVPATASVKAKAVAEEPKVHAVLAELKKSDLDADDQMAYAKLLVDAGYSSASLLKRLDESKLIKIGITKVAHIEVILDVVAALNVGTLTKKLESIKLAKTVMISYQWDSQALAFKVRDFFERNEIRVIIDHGGIKSNILAWMADAVTNADVILLIITQKYTNSESCKQEAAYAHEMKKKIVPLIGEPNYKLGNDWLSLLISGRMRYDILNDFNESMSKIRDRELDD